MTDKILVIEDEAIIRDLLLEFLTGLGYSVILAKTASEGLKEAQDSNVKLVLVDLRLPDQQGIEIIKKLKAARPDIAPVIMTAFPTPESRAQANELGVTAYLTKPFNLAQLQALIQKTLK